VLLEKKKLAFDLKIFLAIILLLILVGFIFIYSSSSVFALEKMGQASFFVRKQFLGFILGLFAIFITINLPLNFIKKFTPAFFLFSLLLTSLTLIPQFSLKIHGSNRWLSLGGIAFQPSELIKIGLMMYTAYFLDKKLYKYGSFFKNFLPLLLILGITALILLRQPDFGLTAALYVTIFSLLFIANYQIKYLILTVFMAFLGSIVLILYKPYRFKRVLTFLDPWKDPLGSGFQIIQSLIAIGSGNFWGVGISNSRQKFFYLPMQHTDFIFSIIAEETGFLGSLLLILLFILFLYFGLRIILKLEDNFSLFAGLGFIILISLQALINFCVVTGLLPTKGVGLPFVSYGLSSLICSMTMIGLILNFVKNNS